MTNGIRFTKKRAEKIVSDTLGPGADFEIDRITTAEYAVYINALPEGARAIDAVAELRTKFPYHQFQLMRSPSH